MKLNKFDIGGEIISILTKGMYPDPRDAIREYIQNSVDANAKNIDIKVRENSIVVEDDGHGMIYKTLRKAIRLGVSDKKPGKDVGFMGIGIYSAFHLCNTLTIYSRKKMQNPLKLELDFQGMRNLLDSEKEKRLLNKMGSEELTDLQTLLENHITLFDEDELSVKDYPVKHGTRVELVGLDPILDDLLSNFDDLAKYIKDVVPLHFDSKKFKWGSLIEKNISEICKKHNFSFEIVNIKLQVGGRIENLYRPYLDSDFANETAQEPLFVELKIDKIFMGIAWGCLNSSRDKLKSDVRGFIVKKQGFSIGNRETISKLFGKANSHFGRYVGEIVVVNPELLPNAARNDFQFSSLRNLFYTTIAEIVAPFYNGISNKFQEESIALSILNESIIEFKKINAKFNQYDDNPETLIDCIVKLNSIKENFFDNKKKNKRYKWLDPKKKLESDLLFKQILDLEKTIQNRINILSKIKPKNKNTSNQIKIAKSLSKLEKEKIVEKRYEDIIELLIDLDLEPDHNTLNFIDIIDEMVIQEKYTPKDNYYNILNEIKRECLKRFGF